MYATWIEPKSRTNFFQLIANDDELQDYDVFTFGYRTGYWRGAPIDNAAVQLRAALTHLPQSYENIVFIAHSMGFYSSQYGRAYLYEIYHRRATKVANATTDSRPFALWDTNHGQ